MAKTALEGPRLDPETGGCPLFRLPAEIRLMIYRIAFPKINQPHHLFLGPYPHCKPADDTVARVRQTTDASNRPTFHLDFYRRHPGKYILSRTVCKGLFEDGGNEIRARRVADGLLVPPTGHDKPQHSNEERERTRQLHKEYKAMQNNLAAEIDLEGLAQSPVPLLQTCRRIYEDVAPCCYHSISLSDLGTAAKFLAATKDLDGLWRHIQKLSVDVVLQRADLQAHKAVQIWRSVCQQLSTKTAVQAFRVRVEIPMDNSPSFVKYVESKKGGHVLGWSNRWLAMMLEALKPIAEVVPHVEVEVSYIPAWNFAEKDTWNCRRLRVAAGDENLMLEGGFELQGWAMTDGCVPAAGYWRLDPWVGIRSIGSRVTENGFQ
jgi:hypothetical protein